MITAIFSIDQTGGIGNRGTLPWKHHPEDMQWFRELTLNQVVVMGRRTWDDPKMPKPLKNRTVYVATNRPTTYAGIISGNLVNEVLELEKQHSNQTIWIVGGPKIIESCINILDSVYLTHFKGSYKIDTRIDLKSFLTGFTPVRAEVAQDFQSTFVKYEPIFKRITSSS